MILILLAGLGLLGLGLISIRADTREDIFFSRRTIVLFIVAILLYVAHGIISIWGAGYQDRQIIIEVSTRRRGEQLTFERRIQHLERQIKEMRRR